ncbi:MAG TPA: proton-conducting transporter membrane subunit [Petrotogaceae bacterium]|nr:proton-conducting transporter membrane subunit [Petrotogaceae bacterium]HQC39829.1 proton-conducting transporter membrane subunit [Petrotogaceae bacterium]
MQVLYFIFIAVISVLFFVLIKNVRYKSYISVLSSIGNLLVVLKIAADIQIYGSISYFTGTYYIDSLSLIQLFIITFVALIASIYSVKYITAEVEEGVISSKKATLYFILFSIFSISMIFVAISNNMISMWIWLEATTLSTAFLISFDGSKHSLEAAWKYLILCSLGIAVGLIGILVFIYSAGKVESANVLKWDYLVSISDSLDINLVKIAFTLIFIGLGTKAGLAPMHTWLPDGHSQAPAPISAMMSGALLNLAMYVIIRFYTIISNISALKYMRFLFTVFGLLSLVVAAFSMIKAKNIKRLLAYSSIENIGIISIGIGFGFFDGIYGSLLHSIIHAFAKTLLFLIAGNIIVSYKTKNLSEINGMIYKIPINSVFIIIGMLVITGMPPFASFFSELKILNAGFSSNYAIVAIITVFLTVVVFGAFLSHFTRMIFFKDKDTLPDEESLREKETNVFPLMLSLIMIVLASLYFLPFLNKILEKATLIVLG